MKKGILLIAVILLSTAGLAQAQEDELGVTLGVQYMSRYIWRGFDIYPDNHSTVRPFIDIDFYGTGFGLHVLNPRSIGGGRVDLEKINYTLYYRNKLFEGETYATNYKVGWVYYNYPDRPSWRADLQEIFTTLSWPEICPAGIVPKYTIVRMWPAESDARRNNVGAQNNGGWWHILGFGYDLSVPGLMPDTPEQILHLSAETAYNDGVYRGGKTVDHDFSHAVFGVSTNFDLGNDLTFTPGFYYQSSWDDSVNASDEYWLTLSLKYKF